MKHLQATVVVFLMAGVLLAGVAGFAQSNSKTDLSKAKATVCNISQAGPTQASSGPKASPVGQPVTSTSKQPGYKPQQPSPEKKHIVVPPPQTPKK